MPRFYELEVAEVRPEAGDCLIVRFAVPEPLWPAFAYRQGQHLILKAGTPAGEELRRTYSICASPAERDLRICVKRQPGGRFSGLIAPDLRPGQRLAVMPPAGGFSVPL